MANFNVDIKRCKGCGLCIPVCPKNILKMSDESNEFGNFFVVCIDDDKCIKCGQCAAMCPDWAITIHKGEQNTVTEKKS